MARKKQKHDASHIESTKIEPKLRMFANANQEVNEIRAEFTGNIAIRKGFAPPVEQVRFENPGKASTHIPADAKKKDLTRPSRNIETNVFIELSAGSSGKIKGEITRNHNLVSAKVLLTDLKKIAERDDVIGIENSRMLKFTDPLVNETYVKKAPESKYRRLEEDFKPKHKVLVGIIDVGGFDFAHPDF